jgi:hypothetical protein
MEISQTTQDTILSSIGLKRRMVSPALEIVYGSTSMFSSYVTTEYRESERRQTDEFYRMSEFNLLHNASGLRLCYLSTESYYGETVDYRLKDIFILTLTKERLTVADVDFINEVFYTTNEQIPFARVDKLPRPD